MIYIFQANSQGLTSDTWSLRYPLLKEIKVLIPTYEEQQKISLFLKQIDKNIEYQKEKLKKQQLLKKIYLEKMFI